MSNEINIITEGRRAYIVGNTYAIKDAIKEAGGHWDSEYQGKGAWWVGTQLIGRIQTAIDKAKNSAARQQASGVDSMVLGKATYKGKTYFVGWYGRTRGEKDMFRLIFLDGSKDFWADANEVQWTKRYQEKRTIRSVNEYAEKARNGTLPPSRASIRQQIESLEDMDCFEEARRLARQHGIPY